MKLCQHNPLVKTLIPGQQQHNQAQVFHFDSLPQIPQMEAHAAIPETRFSCTFTPHQLVEPRGCL